MSKSLLCQQLSSPGNALPNLLFDFLSLKSIILLKSCCRLLRDFHVSDKQYLQVFSHSCIQGLDINSAPLLSLPSDFLEQLRAHHGLIQGRLVLEFIYQEVWTPARIIFIYIPESFYISFHSYLRKIGATSNSWYLEATSSKFELGSLLIQTSETELQHGIELFDISFDGTQVSVPISIKDVVRRSCNLRIGTDLHNTQYQYHLYSSFLNIKLPDISTLIDCKDNQCNFAYAANLAPLDSIEYAFAKDEIDLIQETTGKYIDLIKSTTNITLFRTSCLKIYCIAEMYKIKHFHIHDCTVILDASKEHLFRQLQSSSSIKTYKNGSWFKKKL